MHGQHYQLRSVADVLDELTQIDARYIFFVDDNLTVNTRRTIELCKGMVQRRLGKRFAIQASLDMGLDEELLFWLRRAGCFLTFVGIESVEESTLRHLRKAANLRVGVQHYQEIIGRIHAHGIAVSAGIIFGNDSDTLETYQQLTEFVAESGIDSPVYTILTPLPGSELWDRIKAEGRLLFQRFPEDYAYYDAHHVTFQPPRITAEELLAAKLEAVRSTTTATALACGLWRTWRRTGNLLAALASLQNKRWARHNARSL
jgi:radical SAM superfamily enzyme YgiQ (UPF0313 family)